MSSKASILPIFKPQHFNDYEFDPQHNYFQVLQEARKRKLESRSRTIDLQHKLQKPNSNNESSKKIKKRWWSNTLMFFKSSRKPKREHVSCRVGSVSSPVYITESRSGSWTPYRMARKPGAGPVKKGEVDIPYVSLKELNNRDHQHCKPAIPIYLVT